MQGTQFFDGLAEKPSQTQLRDIALLVAYGIPPNKKTGTKKKIISDDTPLGCLKKRIQFYHEFIDKLRSRDGISEDVPQEKIDMLVKKYFRKIIQFSKAIQKLKQ